MQEGITVLEIPNHAVCMPLTFGKSVLHFNKIVDAERGCKPTKSPDFYGCLGASLRRHVEISETRLIFIAICVGMQWDMIKIMFNIDGMAEAQWGDSLLGSTRRKLLETMKRLVEYVLGIKSVAVWNGNFMRDIGYERQRDGFSCGFYLIAVMRSYAVRSDYIPEVDYLLYSAKVTEVIRDGYTGKYINYVIENHEGSDNSLRDVDVFRSI